MSVAMLLRAPQARRVDRHERLAVQLEPHVDAVARGARHFADDHPLGLGQRVDERALAHVAAADDRHLHHRLGQCPRRRVRRRPSGSRSTIMSSNVFRPRFCVRAGPHQLAPAELVEFVGLLSSAGSSVLLATQITGVST